MIGYPPGAGGSGGGAGGALLAGSLPLTSNEYNLSPLVAILPFIEQQPLWELISNPQGAFPAMGPNPSADGTGLGYQTLGAPPQRPWDTQIATYICPSHPDGTTDHDFGKTNYVGCWGDNYNRIGESASNDSQGKRGLFSRLSGASQPGNVLGFNGFRDCLDGTTNTIAMGEICFSTGRREVKGNVVGLALASAAGEAEACRARRDANRPAFYPATGMIIIDNLRGSRWSEGSAARSSFVTVLPPNSASCIGSGVAIASTFVPPTGAAPYMAKSTNGFTAVAAGTDDGSVLNTAASYHPGGCHVVMLDGAVKFITDNIEAGSASARPICGAAGNLGQESGYGLWGALGSKAGSENRTL